MKTRKILALIAIVFLNLQVFSQQEITTGEQKTVIRKIEQLMDSIYVFPDVATEATALLKQNYRRGNYALISSWERFASTLAKDLRSVTNDLHIDVKFDPEAIAEEKKQKTNLDMASGTFESLKMENFGFKEVKILDGNIGYIDMRIFISPEYAAETAIAAMNFLGNTDAIIFDLRNHRGGSPQMIQLLQSYLFDSEPVHLNNFYFRPADKHTQTWTLPHVPGKRNPEAEVYVLASKRSFSAAEEFAFNIKNLERGTLIGETTGGAANPGRTHNIDDNFTIFIPSGRAYSPVTDKNWEGTGVEPHIEIPEEKALSLAHTMAIKELLQQTNDTAKKDIYNWHLTSLRAEKNPVMQNVEQLNSFTGTYGGNKIKLRANNLIYETRGMELDLVQLDNYLFFFKDKPEIRLEFTEDKKQLKEIFISGKTRTFSRE